MRLRSVRLRQFRAHTDSSLTLAPGLTLLLGPNGAGKTNVLEAISLLCLGKSFLASTDAPLVQRGAGHVEVEGETESDRGTTARLRVAIVPGEGKRAFANGVALDRLADLVGRVPLVILSPADYELTAGGPAVRRQMIDATLSQAYPVYLTDLLSYRRALRQRNALLFSVRRGGSLAPGTMDAWDAELATHGARLVARRAEFLDRFGAFVAEAHALLYEPGPPPSLRYAPSFDIEGDPLTAFRQALARTERRGRDSGRTLVGPHLDEVTFLLDGVDLRPYASQGQHRTFALTLRIAQALFLREHLDEAPVLLLDDVFGPLDEARSRVLLSLLASQAVGQSIVTAARSEPFQSLAPLDPGQHAVFHVEHGTAAPALLSTPLPL
ncbi:MAG TPA: DNA replication/repair protein RecF [Rubricoccaceae bacterium]|jgi:DNA replication and repair protein RecF